MLSDVANDMHRSISVLFDIYIYKLCLGIDVQKRGEVIVGYLSTIFLFLAFSNHMISILMKKYYVENMEKGRNIIRWIEYSISASVMHVMTSLLCGIMDMWALVMIFGMYHTLTRPLLYYEVADGDGQKCRALMWGPVTGPGLAPI